MRDFIPILIGMAIASVIVALAIFAPNSQRERRVVAPIAHTSSDDGIGIGITFTGKPGIELAPGIVMGYDGSIGPGF